MGRHSKGTENEPSPLVQNGPADQPSGMPTPTDYSENTSLRIDQLRSKSATPKFVYVLTFFSAIGGFLFGYDTGVISGAMILLRDHFVLSSVWQELIVSVTIGAAAIFTLLGGVLNDRVGRKPVILVASLIFTAGALCLAFATDRYLLLVGRIIVGAGIGESSQNRTDLRRRGTLKQCWVNVETASQTLAQHIPSIASTSCVCWENTRPIDVTESC